MTTFERDGFVAQCQEALRDTNPQGAVKDLLARATSTPQAVLQALVESERGGVHILHRADDLTVLNVQWAPRMTLRPHDHHMWAVIGVYSGREDNIFWRRLSPAGARGEAIEAAGARSLAAGDVTILGEEIVHSVTNPLARMTGAIHVYGGDFFAQPRSEWDPETLIERPYDIEANMKLFAEFNAGADAGSGR